MTQVTLDHPSAQEKPSADILTTIAVRNLSMLDLERSGITQQDDFFINLKLEFLTAKDAARRKFASAPGILHPYFYSNGRVNGLKRIRYLPGYEPADPKRPDHVMRYGHPAGAPPDLYMAPMLDWKKIFHDPTIPIYFTEGWKKAIAAIKYLSVPCLAYDGIWSFGKSGVLLAVYNEIVWRNRTVYILNDADVAVNPDSLRGENLHAKLLTERCVERVMICRYPKNCKEGKLDDALVKHGAKWFTVQVLKKAVEWDATVATDIPIGLEEEPVRTIASIPSIPERAMYGKAGKIARAFGTPLSLTYPAVLAGLAAGLLPIQGDTRGTLYTVLLHTSGGGKSVVTKRVALMMENAGRSQQLKVLRRLPVSDRGLINALKAAIADCPVDMAIPSVLMILDELKSLFSKASIENSTIYGVTNELFYETSVGVADKKGADEVGSVHFNLLGNLPCKSPAEFADMFTHESQAGFYRRCLFGIGLASEPFDYQPQDDKIRELWRQLQMEPVKVSGTPKMYERMNEWKQVGDEEQQERRANLAELIIRVALVTSSVNGDTNPEKAMDSAVAFIEWQERIRTVYVPSKARTPYAQCMDMVIQYLEKSTGFINWTKVCLNRHWHKREFAKELRAVKSALINDGILVPHPSMKGLFYYRKEAQ
jgi:hypothetical protein